MGYPSQIKPTSEGFTLQKISKTARQSHRANTPKPIYPDIQPTHPRLAHGQSSGGGGGGVREGQKNGEGGVEGVSEGGIGGTIPNTCTLKTVVHAARHTRPFKMLRDGCGPGLTSHEVAGRTNISTALRRAVPMFVQRIIGWTHQCLRTINSISESFRKCHRIDTCTNDAVFKKDFVLVVKPGNPATCRV